jgi:hypothetical protein
LHQSIIYNWQRQDFDDLIRILAVADKKCLLKFIQSDQVKLFNMLVEQNKAACDGEFSNCLAANSEAVLIYHCKLHGTKATFM